MIWTRKYAPGKINWLIFWKYRYLILHVLSNVAHGTERQSVALIRSYGGIDVVGRELYLASREILLPRPPVSRSSK